MSTDTFIGARADSDGASKTGSVWAPLGAWWLTLGGRERALVGWGAAVLALVLLWSLALGPALRTLGRAPAELQKLDDQLQTMRQLADETTQLRAIPAVAPEQAAAALRSAVARLGSKAKLTVQGERAVVTLTGLEPSAVGPWLSELRAGARARVIEATLTRAGAGYSGTVVFALGNGP
jgi:general secretion pathway protein M